MKVITCCNDKGGSCKTTTILNLASQKALEGHNVLMIDLDSCGILTEYCRVSVEEDDVTIGKLLMPSSRKRLPEWSASDILKGIYTVDVFTEYTASKRKGEGLETLCIIPTVKDGELISVVNELSQMIGREKVLKALLKKLEETELIKFDYVFIDCPGAMNVLTVNALVAADSVIVPFEATQSNVVRLSEVFDTIYQIKELELNSNLEVAGVLACRTKRRKTERDILDDVSKEYKLIGSIKESADVTRNDKCGVAAVVAKPYCDASMSYKDVSDLF